MNPSQKDAGCKGRNLPYRRGTHHAMFTKGGVVPEGIGLGSKPRQGTRGANLYQLVGRQAAWVGIKP